MARVRSSEQALQEGRGFERARWTKQDGGQHHGRAGVDGGNEPEATRREERATDMPNRVVNACTGACMETKCGRPCPVHCPSSSDPSAALV